MLCPMLGDFEADFTDFDVKGDIWLLPCIPIEVYNIQAHEY